MRLYFNSSIRKKIQICAIFIIIVSCEDRLFNNVYDGQYSLPYPTNLSLEQISDNEIQLFWNYSTKGINGFIIDKSFDGGDWQIQYIITNENETSCIDTEIIYDKSHEYRISAFADENISTPSMQSSIVPYYIAPLAFQDDFSGNNFEWQVPSGSWNIVNGELIIDGPNDDYQHIAYKEASNNLEQPFRYVVDIDHITGNDEISAIGIGLYNMIEEKTIVYFINPDGFYSLQVHDWNSNEWTNLIEPKASVYISDNPATIEIIYYNDEMELYYNGNYLNNVSLYDKVFRAFILYHQGSDKFSFDNVKYYAFELGPLSKTIRIFNNFIKLIKTDKIWR